MNCNLKAISATLFLSLFILSACSSDDKDDYAEAVRFINPAYTFNHEGMWNQADTEDGNLVFGDFVASHTHISTPYEYTYGFVPSTSISTVTYSTSAENLANPYRSIVGGGVFGSSIPYLVGYWDSYIDGEDPIAEDASCYIEKKDGSTFSPAGIMITNTPWAYEAMKYGSELYPTPFDKKDSCILLIYGSKRGINTGCVKAPLANNGIVLGDVNYNYWIPVDLSELGEVDRIYFRMTSTQENEWGICNPPTYFCIDGFFINY